MTLLFCFCALRALCGRTSRSWKSLVSRVLCRCRDIKQSKSAVWYNQAVGPLVDSSIWIQYGHATSLIDCRASSRSAG
jgi:hypothetical protein